MEINLAVSMNLASSSKGAPKKRCWPESAKSPPLEASSSLASFHRRQRCWCCTKDSPIVCFWKRQSIEWEG